MKSGRKQKQYKRKYGGNHIIYKGAVISTEDFCTAVVDHFGYDGGTAVYECKCQHKSHEKLLLSV